MRFITGMFCVMVCVGFGIAISADADKVSTDEMARIHQEMVMDTTTFVPVVIRASVVAKGEKIGEVSVVLKDTTIVQFGTTRLTKVFEGGTLIALTLENTDGWVREETYGKPYVMTLDGERLVIQNRRIKTYKKQEGEK